ncbi:MAG: hypothetical protein IKO63_06675 [Paludibacteraceae bacterium]|nr:hypothetical protein [Paludibacteraceae bacterium]
MKKSILLTLALVAATLLASAKQYCHEPLTQGNNTIYLTCELLSSTYTMTIEADVDLAGLGGSFMHLNGTEVHDLREFLTIAPDKKSMTIAFASSTAPNFYTPLYVMMPGEVNFGMLTDVEWGLCSIDDTEYTITVVQPAEGGTISASLQKATYGTQVTLTATPNEGKQLYKWLVTDAEDNEVSVNKGKFNMPASNVTVTATFRDELHLIPATFSGKSQYAGANFTWSVTRNVDQTLTFAISWDKALEGTVPQVCINDVFMNMHQQGQSATYTTSDTYEDGTELPFFFYVAYTGDAARIDVSYTVGETNDPNQGSAVENAQTESATSKVMIDGQLLIIRNGERYNAAGVQVK